jgi:hypothetical protein
MSTGRVVVSRGVKGGAAVRCRLRTRRRFARDARAGD